MVNRRLKNICCRNQNGFTILELTVVVTIMGILMAYGVPMFQKAFEQARVDLAAANMESLWSAQRLYWAQNRVFAEDISDLEEASLVDPSFLSSLSNNKAPFRYRMRSADDESFTAIARRRNSSVWSGRLQIDEQGKLTGSTQNKEGDKVAPSQI